MPSVVVLYLGGVGRSGTTLLDRLAGQLPSAVSAGEVMHLWERGLVRDELCGCARPFSACPFWQHVGHQAYGGWQHADPSRVLELKAKVDRTRYVPLLTTRRPPAGFADALTAFRSALSPLYRSIAEVAGAEIVVDSSKHVSYAHVLRDVPGVDLRLVHVTRAPQGVAHSWQKIVGRPETRDEEAMPRYSSSRVAARWVSQNLLLERLGSAHGVPRLQVRYEDLVARPAATLHAIAALAGAGLPPEGPDFLSGSRATLTASHTVAGNPMRFQSGDIDLRADEAWRTGLDARSRRTVELLTAVVAPRYGYPRPGSSTARATPG